MNSFIYKVIFSPKEIYELFKERKYLYVSLFVLLLSHYATSLDSYLMPSELGNNIRMERGITIEGMSPILHWIVFPILFSVTLFFGTAVPYCFFRLVTKFKVPFIYLFAIVSFSNIYTFIAVFINAVLGWLFNTIVFYDVIYLIALFFQLYFISSGIVTLGVKKAFAAIIAITIFITGGSLYISSHYFIKRAFQAESVNISKSADINKYKEHETMLNYENIQYKNRQSVNIKCKVKWAYKKDVELPDKEYLVKSRLDDLFLGLIRFNFISIDPISDLKVVEDKLINDKWTTRVEESAGIIINDISLEMDI